MGVLCYVLGIAPVGKKQSTSQKSILRLVKYFVTKETLFINGSQSESPTRDEMVR